LPDEIQTLISAGRYGEVVALCADLLEQVDVESVTPGWSDALRTVFRQAVALARAGGKDSALRVIELMKHRLAAAEDTKVKVFLGAVIMFEAEIRGSQGEHVEAIAAYEEALSLLSVSSRATLRGSSINALIGKARELDSLRRYAEEIVVLDGALAAVKAADEQAAGKRAKQAGMATLFKLDAYLNLKRNPEALELGASLRAALADLPPQPSGAATDEEVVSEALLAQAVAEIVNDGRCWAVFDGVETIATAVATERAVKLYRISEPWAFSDIGPPGPVDMAAALVREVADGYALLAGPQGSSDTSDLPLPKQAGIQRDRLLHTSDVDQWAREHGYPLVLRTPDFDDDAEPTLVAAAERPGWENAEESFVRGIMRSLVEIELVDILNQSLGGREALRDKLFSALASKELSTARQWLQQLAPLGESDPRVGMTIGFQVFARGLFVASHASEDEHSGLPSTARLRQLLHETGGYDWLVSRQVPLPAWTEHRPDSD
jgi:hypothetical protein